MSVSKRRSDQSYCWPAGIEDLFFLITSRLVERKSQIESERILRSRDSVMLRDSDDNTASAAGGWCC